MVMTIAIVLAATLFFTGTLTGDVTRRSDFSNQPIINSQANMASCTYHKFGEILPGRVAVIKEVGEDCKEKIIEYCSDYGKVTNQPFKTIYLSYGVSDVICSSRSPDSSMRPPSDYGG